MEGELLFIVLIADLILKLDLFEELFGYGGVVAVGGVVVAEGHLLPVIVLSQHH